MSRRPLRTFRVTIFRYSCIGKARSVGNAVSKSIRALHRLFAKHGENMAPEQKRQLMRSCPQLRTDHESGGWVGVSVECVG